METKQDRKMILLVAITVILNIVVLWFLFVSSEEKSPGFSDARFHLVSDTALFDYWDDWRVGETVTPKDSDAKELLDILDRQNWEEYSWSVYQAADSQAGDGQDTAVFTLIRQLEDGESLFGRSGDVLASYRIDLWSGTVMVGDLFSSSSLSGTICLLDNEDILKIKEILYRNFAGGSENAALNYNKPNFTFRQAGDMPLVYSISLYTRDNRFSISAIHMSSIIGGTYEYIREEDRSRLILKLSDDVYYQFRVEKGKLIYDQENSQGSLGEFFIDGEVFEAVYDS